MRTRRPPSTFWQLGLLVAGLCVVWLILLARGPGRFDGFAEQLDGSTVAHWEQADDGSVLMSCADEPRSSNEPLWCASPDAPHCSRGTPTPAGGEPWLGSVFAFFATPPVLPRRLGVLTDAHKGPARALGTGRTQQEPLERPPRHA